MVLSAGETRKNVQNFVLITPEAREAIDVLIAGREAVGVPKTNRFLFAQPAANTRLTSLKRLVDIARGCPSLEYPERITPQKLREYMTSLSQVCYVTLHF